MNRKERYEMVVEAKEAVVEFIEKFDEETLLDVDVRHLTKESIAAAVAVQTVIMTGAFREEFHGGYTFMMPSTKDCLSNWAICKKKLFAKGKRLQPFVYAEFGI